MKKNKMKSPLEVPAHFLKVFNEPKKSDYFVENYGNTIALAKSCGVAPIKVFELICREVKTRHKHYQEQALIAESINIEQLVNEFNDRKKKNSKYAMTTFFNTKFRKDWSLRTGVGWNTYKRFHEVFPKWLRIFNARAKKFGTKDEAEIDVQIQLLNEKKKGK